MDNNIINKLHFVFLMIFFLLMAICVNNSMGFEARDQIKVDINFFPKTKNIRLTISNIGKTPLEIYNPDWKSNKVRVPDYLQVKIRNTNNIILSDVSIAKDGFLTSKVFISSLVETPVEAIILETNNSISREIEFNDLIMGLDKYLPDLSEVKDIKLKYSLFFDEQLRTEEIYTTDWLPYKEHK